MSHSHPCSPPSLYMCPPSAKKYFPLILVFLPTVKYYNQRWYAGLVVSFCHNYQQKIVQIIVSVKYNTTYIFKINFQYIYLICCWKNCSIIPKFSRFLATVEVTFSWFPIAPTFNLAYPFCSCMPCWRRKDDCTFTIMLLPCLSLHYITFAVLRTPLAFNSNIHLKNSLDFTNSHEQTHSYTLLNFSASSGRRVFNTLFKRCNLVGTITYI